MMTTGNCSTATASMVARIRQEGDGYWVARPRAIPEPPISYSMTPSVALCIWCLLAWRSTRRPPPGLPGLTGATSKRTGRSYRQLRRRYSSAARRPSTCSAATASPGRPWSMLAASFRSTWTFSCNGVCRQSQRGSRPTSRTRGRFRISCAALRRPLTTAGQTSRPTMGGVMRGKGKGVATHPASTLDAAQPGVAKSQHGSASPLRSVGDAVHRREQRPLILFGARGRGGVPHWQEHGRTRAERSC